MACSTRVGTPSTGGSLTRPSPSTRTKSSGCTTPRTRQTRALRCPTPRALRARLGLKYGRLLTGWAEARLTAWAAHDTADALGHALYKVELPDIMAMMRAICDGECENPHWVLDFALNIVPLTRGRMR